MQIVFVFKFLSRSSWRVCNSRGEREYIGPKGRVFPSSRWIVRSYGQWSRSSLAFYLLKMLVQSLYYSGNSKVSRKGSNIQLAWPLRVLLDSTNWQVTAFLSLLAQKQATVLMRKILKAGFGMSQEQMYVVGVWLGKGFYSS